MSAWEKYEIGFGVPTEPFLHKEEPKPNEQAANKPVVETIKVSAYEDNLEIAVEGIVVPYREIQVSSEVAGRIVEKTPACKAGMYVSDKSIMLKIDSADYDLELQSLIKELEEAVVMLKELEVQVENAQALISLAKSDLELQQRELERAKQLRLQNAISESQLVKANQGLLATKTILETKNNELRLLKTRRFRLTRGGEKILIRLKKAYLDAQRTIITAPVAGVIVEDLVEQGEYIKKGDQLFTIEETSAVEVSCNLKMEELAWIWQQRGNNATSAPVHDNRAQSANKKKPAETDLTAALQKQLEEHRVISTEINKLLAGVEGENFDQIHEQLIRFVDRILKQPAHGSWHSVKQVEHADQKKSALVRTAYELPVTPVKVVYTIQGTDTVWQGELYRYDGIGLDEKTRMVPCRIIVHNPLQANGKQMKNGVAPPALLRGMYVQLKIVIKPATALLRLPVDAVHPGGNVWVVKSGKLHVVPITIAHQTDSEVLVQAESTDLVAGDEVVVSPLINAGEGIQVQTN